MEPRSLHRAADVPSRVGVSALITGMPEDEAREIGRSLSRLKSGRVVSFHRPTDAMANRPVGRVDLAVVGTADLSPSQLSRMLGWLRRQWPRAMAVVISQPSPEPMERVAREHGAFYLPQPAGESQWNAILDGALQCRRVQLKSA